MTTRRRISTPTPFTTLTSTTLTPTTTTTLPLQPLPNVVENVNAEKIEQLHTKLARMSTTIGQQNTTIQKLQKMNAQLLKKALASDQLKTEAQTKTKRNDFHSFFVLVWSIVVVYRVTSTIVCTECAFFFSFRIQNGGD